ncbi:variant erythrocyte surface antigen-1 family protein, partial [Babesia divergens]
MARLVCYMYYTDVFVGTGNIDNLNKALKAELPSFNVNSNDLTQLVHGLCLFMGYPSCLCKPKKSVKESLEKISGELKGDLQNYKCLSNSKPLNLNCNSCSTSDVVCKCCVLDCISKVQEKCQCVKGSNNNDCSCPGADPKRCCKDLLEKLKASLSLLNLKADMETLCKCPPDCCVNGVCTDKSSQCTHCINLKTPNASKDYTVTGLGLLRPSPKRLAERLDTFFGSGQTPKNSCKCQCGTSGSTTSCCCLACESNMCLKSCDAMCGSQGCSSQHSQECPCKTFCSNINSIQVASDASLMKCCNGGKSCHCHLSSGQGSSGCCDGTGKKSVKCMLRRVVSYFKSLETSSSPDKFFKSCCDLLCVIKTCEFLKGFYDKRTAKECSKCKSGGQGKCSKGSSGGTCCKGTISKCTYPTCCSGCNECREIKEAKEFSKALETLKLSSPCGQDLYRTLDDFLYFCCYVIAPQQRAIENKIKGLQEKHCQKASQTPQCCPKTPSAKPCTCPSGSSSCQACQQLSKDSQLKPLLFSEFSSAYSEASASWPDCSKPSSSGPCCGSSPCPSCSRSPGQCPPQGCCEKCPKRLCAKIFLGMLPCMYWGLKILYDRAQDPLTWPTWQHISRSSIGSFLGAWGYGVGHLKNKKGSEIVSLLDSLYGSDKIFEKLSTLVTEKYFTSHLISSPSQPNPPSTVRQMLLWLYGLRFTSGFPSLVSHCSSLCSPFGNSFNSDAFCYYIHVSCFLLPVSVISVIQCPDGSPSFLPSHSDWQNFCYPEDPSALADMLFEYIRKIYIPLTFIRFQCQLGPDQAGWRDCYFGQGCAVSSSSVSPSGSTSGCSCPNSKAYLCTNSHSSCSGSSSSSCPHPLLNFLIDDFSDSTSQPSVSKSLFKPPKDFPKMGFKAESLPSTGRNGESLHGAIICFCKDGFYPLTRLVEFSFCIFRNPPDTLGELFAFFKKFAAALNSKPELSSTFVNWINGEPGSYSGSALKDALVKLYDSHSNSHPFDLYSLIHCSSQMGSTCGQYLYPLTYNAYNNNIFIKDFLDTYLSWVCYLTPKFKTLFEKFKEKFKSCCSTGSCEKIVTCPCALPFLYSFGFGFWSPKGLNCPGHGGHKGKPEQCTRKTCKDFIAQLKKVLGLDSHGSVPPIKNLLRIIDEFIWHIRLPFIYAF